MQDEIRTRLVYPDPMKPSGFEFDLPADAVITLEIFDDKGIHQKTIINKQAMNSGKQVVEFKNIGLNEGKFTFRLKASVNGKEFLMTKNVVIERDDG